MMPSTHDVPITAELVAAVAGLIKRVAADELMPRFARADPKQIHRKGSDDVVTDADLAVERFLGRELGRLIPGAAIVGEEACHQDPSLLAQLGVAEVAWVIDPLDGTRHFAAGVQPFGIMAALVRRGRTEAGWIYLPMSDSMVTAQRGGGATLDGRPVHIAPAPAIHQARGALLTRFVPEPVRSRVESARSGLRTDESHQCAARQYVDLLKGEQHFAFYHRTLPWDHAPGVLIVEEAGAVARRVGGEPYQPSRDETGLLIASDAELWAQLKGRLFGDTVP